MALALAAQSAGGAVGGGVKPVFSYLAMALRRYVTSLRSVFWDAELAPIHKSQRWEDGYNWGSTEATGFRLVRAVKSACPAMTIGLLVGLAAMTPEEIEAALRTAFERCDRADFPLNREQQQILRRSLGVGDPAGRERNPLKQLTFDERQALLEFVHAQQQQAQSWKMVLLNDWLNGRDSGPVQFIRDRYGIQWLEQIKPIHLADYDDRVDGGLFRLQVGDRIEVSNGLWEWVQDSGPCSREWFSCTVTAIREPMNSAYAAEPLPDEMPKTHASCIVQFDSGAEYEIQGIYEWNRPNWRWPEA